LLGSPEGGTARSQLADLDDLGRFFEGGTARSQLADLDDLGRFFPDDDLITYTINERNFWL